LQPTIARQAATVALVLTYLFRRRGGSPWVKTHATLASFLAFDPTRAKACGRQNKASCIAPLVNVEKQERNLNTKGTKRTKKKEIDA